MTASEQARAAGLESLQIVANMTGVSRQTLRNWSIHRPELFAVILAGCNAPNIERELGPLHDALQQLQQVRATLDKIQLALPAANNEEKPHV